MDRSCLFIVFALVMFVSVFQLKAEKSSKELPLMPMPQKVIYENGKFRLNASFTVSVCGKPTERLCRAATRILRRLSGRTGLFFPQAYITPDTRDTSANFIIQAKRPGELVLREDESYSLAVSPKHIRLTAETDIGVLRGLEIFLQLLQADETGYYIPAVKIEDWPRFPWRGLLIDVCRHFMPVEVIKRNLDGMAAVKLNVFHWHLSEDQGFRVECKTYPKLHQMGSDGLYYTQDQIKDIIAYAADRGIRVVPEFDMPGHSTSWFVGYPELASGPGPYHIIRKWGVLYPIMDPTREETYQFLDNFLKEMTKLFPDEYFHIGGDEVNGKQWNENPKIQAFMKANNIKNNHELQRYFNKRILKILGKYGKKMIGWDEILQPNLPKNIVIQAWRGREPLVKAATMGYQTILSNGYYIDLIKPASVHYLNDPVPEDSKLTDEEKKFVLGGEATMWAEFISPETIDSRIWPRTAAIAERLWSSGHVKDIDDMYKRLEVVSFHLEELGLTHKKNYEMMLRRLTNNADITPLKTLVDVIEPVKNYSRGATIKYTFYSPLTRVVDAARPDAKVARDFRNLVEDYLSRNQSDSTKLESIKNWFHLWEGNHSHLIKIISRSPILWEIKPLSQDLRMVSLIGLESLDYIENGQQADKKWVHEKLEILKKAWFPKGETQLMIIPAVEKLVKHAGGE